jgi:hypothetical protein
MSKVYAVREDNRLRVLLEIQCDGRKSDGEWCTATIRPNREISKSGWTYRCWDSGIGTEVREMDYCPECSRAHADEVPA